MSKVAVLFLSVALTLGGVYSEAALAQPDRGPGNVAVPELPAGHVARYRLTYMTSQANSSGTRTATVISITNHSGVSCSTSVDWRFGFGGVSCTTALTLGPGQTGEHCSRPLPGAIASCNATCAPALNLIEGSAIVGSRNIAGCGLIAVDGRVYTTVGSTDSAVTSATNPHVVRIGAGNAGD